MRNHDAESTDGHGAGGPAVPELLPPSARNLADLLRSARLEVLPTADVVDRVLADVPPERLLTVTASPARGLDATLDAAVSLAGHGYTVVPHLAARLVAGPEHLAEVVARLRGAGVRRVFVPGGDGEPVGEYADAAALLRDLAALGRPFDHVGIAAYPESHPSIPDETVVRALWDKHDHATELVSNMTFDPAGAGAWVADVRRRGVALPLWFGVPGPIDPTRLLAVATRIGVGESTRFLLKHRGTVARLLRPGGNRGEDFLRRVAPALTRPGAGVVGLHVFTFNQLAETEAWRGRLLERSRATSRPHPGTSRRHP